MIISFLITEIFKAEFCMCMCMSYNFLDTRLFEKVKGVVNTVYKVHFIILIVTSIEAVIFDIYSKVRVCKMKSLFLKTLILLQI